MNNHLKILLILGLSLFIWNACGDDRETVTSVEFQFDFTINNEALELGKTYELNGTAVQFDIARFYVGGIEMQPTTGTNTTFEDLYLLVKAEEQNYTVGNLDFSDYDQVKFFVGVAPKENSQSEEDFTTRQAGDPLAIKDPSMHWSWNTGYKFIRVDGQVDTDGDGALDTPLAFHIGSDGFLRNLAFDTPAIQEGINVLTFKVDFNRLYEDIDLAVDWDTHTGNNLPLAQQFIANFEKALTLE